MNEESNPLNFDKFCQEANAFIGKLAQRLGYPEEKKRTMIVLRAVLHTIRDRITMAESLDLISQLPMILKAVYVEQWKYSEKPPLQYETLEEMKRKIKHEQMRLGERQFDWQLSTEEIMSTVIDCLGDYLTQGQINDLRDQMPKEVKDYV